jgi:hypothetical protein
LFEFIFDLFDCSFIGVIGLGSVVVEEVVDEGCEVEGLLRGEHWRR